MARKQVAVALVALGMLALGGCARRAGLPQRTTIASADVQTTGYREADAAAAEAPLVTEMARALGAANFARVLELEERLPPDTAPNPGIDYNVGSALAGLGRTDEALAAFARAEREFGDRDRRGRSIAIWGRARALGSAGRCAEARSAIEEYARVAGATDPHAIRLGVDYASACK